MSSEIIRMKREQFHIQIRRRTLECTFKLKRLAAAPTHYPVEQLIYIVEKLMAHQELDDNEFLIMNSILDDVHQAVVNDPQQFNEWAEHLRLIQTLVDSMCLASNPKYAAIATKAASCFRQVVKQRKVKINEHFDQVCEIYKTWIDSDSQLLKDNGLRGMTQLANLSSPRLSSYDLVDSVLKSLQINKNNEKALNLLAVITKNIDDDNQVITILRIASKLIDSTDNKLREKGLLILENASRNIQNIQFILTMRVMISVIALVYYREKMISKLAMAILVNLTYTSDVDQCNKLLDMGIMDVAYKLLKNTTFTYCRAYGSMIFNNILASSHLVLDRVVQNNKLLGIVFELMDNDVVDVRRELYQAFKNFLLMCSKDQLLITIDNGLLDYEISGLDDIDPTIVILSLESLSLIFRNLLGTVYETNIYEYFALKKVPKLLDKLQHNPSNRVYELSQEFIQEFYDCEFDQ